MSTIVVKVLPLRLEWRGMTFNRDDVIRYHSHFPGQYRSDFHSNRHEDIITAQVLERAIEGGWFKIIPYQEWWTDRPLDQED